MTVGAQPVPSCDDAALEFAGDYGWAGAGSGELVDFDALVLAPSGLYAARVVATLVNPGVRSFGSVPCMLPEEGEWNAYRVGDKFRLRIRPTTGRARVYTVEMRGDNLEISRRGQRTILYRAQALSTELPAAIAALEEAAPETRDESREAAFHHVVLSA